jgi:hypothetical protein
MKAISRGALVLVLILSSLAAADESVIVYPPEVEIGCIPPNKPNCPPPELTPCLPPLYPPHQPHYPLCEECHWMWPNPLAWCRRVYGTSADHPPFAPWIEGACGSVDCDFVRPPAPIVRRYVTAADAVFLFRDDPDLVAFTSTFGADFITQNGIDMATAPRLQVIAPIDEVCDLEVNYFGLDSWRVTADYDFASGDIGALEFGSELHSAELNFRHNTLDWLTLFSGFRFVEFAEEIDFAAPSVGLPAGWHFDTQNFLYGWQWGADIGLVRLFDRFEINTVVKGGVFDNHADWRHDVATAGALSTFENQFDEVAFVGEASIGGTLRFNDHFALRGGMQGMWLKDVMKAINSFTTPDDTSGLFLYGGYAGIELRW